MEERQSFNELHAGTEALLEACLQLGRELVQANPSSFPEEEVETTEDVHEADAPPASLDKSLSAYLGKTFDLRRRNADAQFSVAVIALAKSGKSTFINALCGAHLLPVSNVPETARICRISHVASDEIVQPQLRDTTSGTEQFVAGEDAIRAHLGDLHKQVRSRDHQLSDEVLLNIHAPLAALGQLQHNNEMSFALLDTPGPNEHGEEALRCQVERLLDGVDAVIYLLDYTKLKTKDEADLFKRLKEINPGLLRRLSPRLRFVVNKIDNIGVSEGLDEDQTRVYVAELVTNQLSSDGFQLLPEQVLLVSAQDAILSRLMLRTTIKPSLRVQNTFRAKAFGSNRSESKKKRSEAEVSAAAQEMLDTCGVKEVEQQVLQTLYARAGPLKLMAIVDDTHRMLSQMANTAAVITAALHKDVELLRTEAAALQCQLVETLVQFDDVQSQTKSLESEIVDEVRTRLFFLGEQLKEKVKGVMQDASAPDHPEVSGRWRNVLLRARTFLGLRRGGASKDSLQQELQKLHQEIFSTIDEEVRAFWHHLEMASNDRQRALVRRLNVHLERLSRAIESVVSDQLSVRLEPVDLRLPERTSATQFHDSLQELFAAGITQTDVTKIRSREVEETQWEKRYRHSICRIGEYYVGKPVKHTVNETYIETEFHVQPDKIQEYFCSLIDTTVGESVRAVRAFVQQHLSNSVATARTSITKYAENFTSAMLNALCTSERGEKARLAALEHSQSRSSRLMSLLQQASALQGQAEALFPSAAEEAALDRVASLGFGDGDLLDDSKSAVVSGADGATPAPYRCAANDALVSDLIVSPCESPVDFVASNDRMSSNTSTAAALNSAGQRPPPAAAVRQDLVCTAAATACATAVVMDRDSQDAIAPLEVSGSEKEVANVEAADVEVGSSLQESVASLFDAESNLGSASFMSATGGLLDTGVDSQLLSTSQNGTQQQCTFLLDGQASSSHQGWNGSGFLDCPEALTSVQCASPTVLQEPTSPQSSVSLGMATICLNTSRSSSDDGTTSSDSSTSDDSTTSSDSSTCSDASSYWELVQSSD